MELSKIPMTIKINNKCHFSERKKENTHKRKKKKKRKKVKMCCTKGGLYVTWKRDKEKGHVSNLSMGFRV
jgi:hypothetical protein